MLLHPQMIPVDGIQAVTFFMAMTTFLSWIAVSYVVIVVVVLFLDTYAHQESTSIMRISPSWRGVRIFKTMPNLHAQIWIPWRQLWPMAKLGFKVWRLNSPERK